jgi:hypothetical protein
MPLLHRPIPSNEVRAARDTRQAIGQLGPLPLDDLALKTLEIEDRPSPQGAIEDADEINKLLGP